MRRTTRSPVSLTARLTLRSSLRSVARLGAAAVASGTLLASTPAGAQTPRPHTPSTSHLGSELRLELTEPDSTLQLVLTEQKALFDLGDPRVGKTEDLCKAPCVHPVVRGKRYRVHTPPWPSASFYPPNASETVHLRVQRGSQGRVGLGILTTAVGLGAVGLGGVFLALGTGRDGNESLLPYAGISAGVGVGLVVAGLLLIHNAQTRVFANGEKLARGRKPWGTF